MRLALPQNCAPEQREERKRQVVAQREEYEFDHSWQGYPPTLKRLPLRELPAEGAVKMIESFFKLEESKLALWWRHVLYKISHLLRKPPPFEEYKALYSDETLPPIGADGSWRYDAVFAGQRETGMYPWFLQQVTDLDAFRRDFPITDEMVAEILPPNTRLADLQSAGRLYFVSHPELAGAPPAHHHVMTAPTSLFYVSDIGQLLPVAIQLYPITSPTNPIFTPCDNEATWLAVKIHSGCADTLVHNIYSHAILMHFVMSNVWTSANRSLPPEHPVHAFLKPHFWATLLVTTLVKGTMDTPDGTQTSIYGTGLDGQNVMVSRLFKGFDFASYNPNVDFANRGVADPEKLPEFYYRDDALKLWQADHAYVAAMMDLFYASDDDVKTDFELQAWVREMRAADGAAIVGLPVSNDGTLETREQLRELMTCTLFTVTSRHSSIENGALKYLYVPANPYLYRLQAPQSASEQLTLKHVADRLPPIDQAIKASALPVSAHFDPETFGRLGKYPADFIDSWPRGAKDAVVQWQAALADISEQIGRRNRRLDNPYTAMNPVNTFNSIWN